ncbi:MAG: inositol-phosphate transport system substrate-binding protein [Thermotogota bacterium]|nr:inositol-phosphate transport system substrate-binding protein [Thermotogota bacterium]MDK2864184.1 inositol-phosphate transport system substrate-binding protein [Thermotogota bacterium]HCZ07446.1 sugar ABC transporter substrate-binding protein [Thermotogota bacterium]
MKKFLVVLLALLATAVLAKEIVITAWTVGPDNPSFYRFENLKTAAERLNKMLEAAGSDIRVKVDGYFDTTDWSSFKQKVVFGMKSKQKVDIICSGHDDLGAWVSAGYLLPLEDLVKKYWDETYYDIIPSLWESCKFKGTIYAVPQDTEARPFYINKQALKELGWSDEEINALPEKIASGEFTLFDFVELAKEAKEKGVVEWGLYHRPKKGIDYFQIFTSFGADFYDEERGVYVYDMAKMEQVFEFFYNLTNVWKLTPSNIIGTPWTSIHKDVTSGKVLAWMGGTWNWAEYKRDFGKTEEELQNLFILAPVPKATPDGKPNTLSHPIVYMIPRHSEYPELAFLLITLATAPELNMKHAVESGHLPIRWQQTVFPEYKNEFIMVEGTKLLPFSSFIPNDDSFDTFNQAIFEGLQMVESGLKPSAVTRDVARRLKSLLKDKVEIVEK